jgi:ascorbate-specific PTS system EIIC-type component UlaA
MESVLVFIQDVLSTPALLIGTMALIGFSCTGSSD